MGNNQPIIIVSVFILFIINPTFQQPKGNKRKLDNFVVEIVQDESDKRPSPKLKYSVYDLPKQKQLGHLCKYKDCLKKKATVVLRTSLRRSKYAKKGSKSEDQNSNTFTINDVASLLTCHDKYIWEAEPPNAAMGSWMLNCLLGSKSKKMYDYFKMMLIKLDKWNIDILENKNEIFKERKALVNVLKKPPKKLESKKQLKRDERKNRKIFTSFKLVFRRQIYTVVFKFLNKFLSLFKSVRDILDKLRPRIQSEKKDGKEVIGKLMQQLIKLEQKSMWFDKIEKELDFERYEELQKSLNGTIENIDLLLEDKSQDKYKFFTEYSAYVNVTKSIEEELEKINVIGNNPKNIDSKNNVLWIKEERPTRGKTLYVIRHANRDDYASGKNLTSKEWDDNSGLATDGRVQAIQLGPRFANIPIDHIFVSPFDRTVDTASGLVKVKNEQLIAQNEKPILLHLENGLMERRDMCHKPPRYRNLTALHQDYPYVDMEYKTYFNESELNEGEEGYGEELDGGDDDIMAARLKKTMDHIFEKYHEANTFVFVSHCAPVGAIHQLFAGDWSYVGLATVSEFVESKPRSGKFRLMYTSDSSHLADRMNLRPY